MLMFGYNSIVIDYCGYSYFSVFYTIMKAITILAIESSCDEGAAAVILGRGERLTVRSNVVYSQIAIHQKYGGVVPEVAAREHGETLLPTISAALRQAFPRLTLGRELVEASKYIDCIAVTTGPGLSVALRMGMEAAKVIGYAWQKPMVSVNHLAGHIYANWLSNKKIKFPLLCLIVSGGHTELVYMKGHGSYKKIGWTIDDAAGEAFDKGAKILGLGYPGGPALAGLAKSGNKEAHQFPRPMIDSNDLQFSFSGLKTSLLYHWRDLGGKAPADTKADIAASYQEAIVDTLVQKTNEALRRFPVRALLLGGGVAANSELRQRLAELVITQFPKVIYIQPELPFATDNAAMIGAAGYFLARKKKFTPWNKMKADPHWSL